MRHSAKLLRTTLGASFVLVAMVGAVVAGPLDDAEAAYNRADYETALRMWRQLVDQGNAQAQNRLGEMYLNGLFEPLKGELVHRNCAEALRLFDIAANHGLAAAQNNLGHLYEMGVCVSTDLGAARQWYRKAADQADADAQCSLGSIYEYGLGVRRDHATAQKWFKLSQSQANPIPDNPASTNPSSSSRRDRLAANGAITLDFTVDSGAADVSVPADVFSTLARTGTIRDADIIGEQTYVLADGSKSQSVTFTIRSLKIGGNVVENVRGSVAPSQGSLLLGQSFLERFKSWSVDNTKHLLLLEPK